MIENPDISNWKTLQFSVCRLLNEVGLSAQEGVVLQTPRGSVEVDVFAVDERSVDNIRYIVECKCWSSAIPQQVVHSFSTVMQETGANIGFIVSKRGLQSGAERYTTNTNILGITFVDLQRRYFDAWWKNHFCNIVANKAEKVCFYTEPFNVRRDEALAGLSDEQLTAFDAIRNDYCAFSMLMWHADLVNVAPHFGHASPASVQAYKEKILAIGEHLYFESIYWRDLLDEICRRFDHVEGQLHQIFGHDVFAET